MKITALLVTLTLLHSMVFSQSADTLSLDACIRLAGTRSPLNRQRDISATTLEYKLKNLGVQWFPAAGLNGKAQYNSETVNFTDLMEGMSAPLVSLPLDQYQLWADINQQVYDGGSVKARKAIEISSHEAEVQQLEADLLGVKLQVAEVYFSLLMNKKNAEIVQVSLNDLMDKKKVIRTGIDNGAVLAENMLSLEAEELRIQQRLIEIAIARDQLLKVLSILTDSSFTENTVISYPAEPMNPEDKRVRPEYVMFEKQKDRLTANQKLVKSTEMPRLYAYSQVGYGRPGYNFASLDLHPYYSVGVGMKWNFLNYGDNRRQKKILDLNKDMVDVKKDVFDDQLTIQLEEQRANIKKFSEFLTRDEQILNLRRSITASSFAKLSHGIITSSDYLTEKNSEILATLQYENHKIQKIRALYIYLLLQGGL